MSTAAALQDFLIAEVEEGNVDFVNQLLELARAKVLAGGGELAPLDQGTINGKNFQRVIRLDAAEVAAACREALRHSDPSYGPITFVDFGGGCRPSCP